MSRESKTHHLKCWPEPFQAIVNGDKRHEFRRDDRDFEVGDMLVLNEWDDGRYTNRRAFRMVSYVSRGPDWGIPEGYVAMSLARISEPSGPTKRDGGPR